MGVAAVNAEELAALRRGLTKGWESAAPGRVLPIAVGRELWKRAEQFDLDRGGRYDVRSACLQVWTGSLDRADSEPYIEVWVTWHAPADREVTIDLIAWDPARGGSETEAWGALAVLAGRDVRGEGVE